MSDARGIRYAVEGALAIVTLDRPDKRNALDDRMVAELKRAFSEADGDEHVRVVLLRGAGPDFCAGADLAQLERIAAGAGPLENLTDAMSLGDLFIRMRRLGKPIVAAVHGNVLAGGAGLASACDLVVAARDAVFGYPEVHLGFVPAMVMAILRRNVGEKLAFELCALGGRIDAERAHDIGLVSRVFEPQEFEQGTIEFASELAGRSGSAVALVKRLLYGIDGVSFEQAIARGAEVNALARATDDCRDGVRRFVDKRRDK